jgi:hypothetical protein
VLLWARYLDPVGGYPGTEAEAEQWCSAEERSQLLALEQMAARDEKAQKARKEEKPSKEPSEAEEQATRKPSNDAGCSRVATSPQDSQAESIFIPSAVRTKLVPSEARVAG